MKKWLNENQMTNLQTLEALGNADEVQAELFDDTAACITGLYENNEYLFLLGLSSGTALVTEEENVGTAARLSYGYLPENRFGVAVDWSDAENARPVDDFKRMFKKAKGRIKILMTDPDTVALLCATKQMREQWAFSKNIVVADTGLIPNLSLENVNEYMRREFKVVFDIVDRSMEAEKNGESIDLTPWQAGSIIGIPSKNVGDLVYARTAEQNAPVAGVEYQLVDGYGLISKYRKNEPAVSEYTQIQARVFPVITNVNRIYQLDITDFQKVAPAEVEDDANITVYEQTLVKADVIAALNALGVKTSANIGDAKLIAKINELDDEQEAALKEALGIAPGDE
jgi:hypothetical protein